MVDRRNTDSHVEMSMRAPRINRIGVLIIVGVAFYAAVVLLVLPPIPSSKGITLQGSVMAEEGSSGASNVAGVEFFDANGTTFQASMTPGGYTIFLPNNDTYFVLVTYHPVYPGYCGYTPQMQEMICGSKINLRQRYQCYAGTVSVSVNETGTKTENFICQ